MMTVRTLGTIGVAVGTWLVSAGVLAPWEWEIRSLFLAIGVGIIYICAREGA